MDDFNARLETGRIEVQTIREFSMTNSGFRNENYLMLINPAVFTIFSSQIIP